MTFYVEDAVKILNEMAPPHMAESWDNVGLLVGRNRKAVRVILCALDFSEPVLRQAEAVHADLVITHHPAIFKGIFRLTDSNWQTGLLMRALRSDIAVFSAHTNLDSAVGGVNDVLCELLELDNVEVLAGEEGASACIVRIGILPSPLEPEQFADRVRRALKQEHITLVSAGRPVQRVAICGGSGMGFLKQVVASGADTYVTGDVKYHDAQDAVGKGLNVIDATHQGSELPIVARIADRLSLRLSKAGEPVTVLVAREDRLFTVI